MHKSPGIKTKDRKKKKVALSHDHHAMSILEERTP